MWCPVQESSLLKLILSMLVRSLQLRTNEEVLLHKNSASLQLLSTRNSDPFVISSKNVPEKEVVNLKTKGDQNSIAGDC